MSANPRLRRVAANHLLGLGHRRIGFITPSPSKSIAQLRIEGFRESLRSMRAFRFALSILWMGGSNSRMVSKAPKQLLSLRYPPTAMVAANDLVAIGAIATLKKHGYRVPKDISVVGIDDIQMAALLDPPLTTVTQPIYEMGRQGMENILLRIQNPELETSEILFETQLTIRQSTAPRLVKKPLARRTPKKWTLHTKIPRTI